MAKERRTDRILRRARAIHAVEAERDRQRQLWGDNDHPAAEWFVILAEEVGEVAHEVCKGAFDQEGADLTRLRSELVQTAAVCVKWIEAIDEAREAGEGDA